MKLLQSKPNVIAPNATYSFGSMKDDTGIGDGSLADTEFMTDYVQFFEKMFNASGLTANGLPDNDVNGYQLYEAFKTLVGNRIITIEMGAWDMDATGVLDVVHNLSPFRILGVSATILPDTFGDASYPLPFVNASNTIDCNVNYFDSTIIRITRVASGFFDNTNFDRTDINRGYLHITYQF